MMCCPLSYNSVSEAGVHAQTFLSVLNLFGLVSVFPEIHINNKLLREIPGRVLGEFSTLC